jgi:archaeosine synthase beta-subunit
VPIPYPDTTVARDAWIVRHRPDRNRLDPFRPYAFSIEEEPLGDGSLTSIATLFLTNRECPWRCVMCDLWRNTIETIVPNGAIPSQIKFALEQLPAAQQIKLYNAGSFFDPGAIPTADHPDIADCIRQFERVIVECHPSLVNASSVAFRDLIPGKLEIALGLETIHPTILPRLNKRMTLEHFKKAAQFLKSNEMDLRVFVLLKPPFLEEEEARYWAERSIEFAFDCGARVVSVIPTRLGNGALEALAENGQFSQPKISTLEAVQEFGLNLKRGLVFADLWDLEKFADCRICFEARHQRLREMNQTQRISPPMECSC